MPRIVLLATACYWASLAAVQGAELPSSPTEAATAASLHPWEVFEIELTAQRAMDKP
jgi:hypothetical protein